MTPTTKLVCVNLAGNLHNVANYCVRFGFSDFFVQADVVGLNSIVLFKVPIDWPCDERGPLPAKEAA